MDSELTSYLDLYLVQREAEGLLPRTLEKYRGSIGLFIAAAGLEAVDDVKPIHLSRWLLEMKARGLSDGSRSTHQRAVWTWFKWLRAQEYALTDPTTRVAAVIVHDQKRRTATPEIRDKLLRVALNVREKPYRAAAIVSTLWATGLRVSELAGVQLSDYDPKAGEIAVTGKGQRRRTVAIGVEARLQIQQYLAKERGGAPGPLFLSRSGGAMNRDSLRLLIGRLAKLAGVTASPHDFRRGFAAWQRSNGLDVGHVMKLMGHSNPAMTLIYSQAGEQEAALLAYHRADAGVRPMRRKA